MANNMHNNTDALAQAGAQFNDATFLLEGGVSTANSEAVTNDLRGAQESLTGLLESEKGNKAAFSGGSAIHLQNVVDQLNLEMAHLHAAGGDPLDPKFVNDVHRDIIDIIQGDATLAGKAGAGFAAVPNLLVPPAQFHDDAAQTAFLAKFTTDSNSLGQRAVDLLTHNPGQAPSPAATALVHEIDTFLTNASDFSKAQGGLFAARFENELGHDGVDGTAGRALIHSLQHGDLNEAKAAADILAQNASDVDGNNLPLGGTATSTGTGIPAHFDTFGQVGTVFNDATVKLIGGVYDNGTTNNRASVIADLTASHDGLQQVATAHAKMFSATSLDHIMTMENLINTEAAAVKAAGTDPLAAQHIHDAEIAVLDIVQKDASLKALAAPDNGFQPLPPASDQHHGMPDPNHDALVAQAANAHPMQVAAADWFHH